MQRRAVVGAIVSIHDVIFRRFEAAAGAISARPGNLGGSDGLRFLTALRSVRDDGKDAEALNRRPSNISFLLSLIAVLLLSACALPTSERILGAYPDNLEDLRRYIFEVDYDAPPGRMIDCGEDEIAAYCPEEGKLPPLLRARYLARKLSGERPRVSKRDPIASLLLDGDRIYFLADATDRLFAADLTGERPLWVARAGLGYDCFGPVVKSGGTLYLSCVHDLGHTHTVVAFSAETGAVLSALNLPREPAALIVWKPGVLVVLENGELLGWSSVEIEARAVGRVPDRFRPLTELIVEKVREPVPSEQRGGVAYLGGKRRLWALSMPEGERLWDFPVPSPVRALAFEESGGLLVLCESGDVVAIDSKDGRELWTWDGRNVTGVKWFLFTLGSRPRWEALYLDAGERPLEQLVFCDALGLCYGFESGKTTLTWLVGAARRQRVTRPFVQGGLLLLDASPDQLIVIPDLPLPQKRR